MPERNPDILIEDILAAIEKIGRYTAGMSRPVFLADDRTIDATVRNLEIIGEAVRQLPQHFKDSHVDTPWGQIAGLRNRIVHDYFGLDLELIWQIVQTDIPALRTQIDDLKP